MRGGDGSMIPGRSFGSKHHGPFGPQTNIGDVAPRDNIQGLVAVLADVVVPAAVVLDQDVVEGMA